MSAEPLSPHVAAIHDLLPQTQCTQCGYAGCQPYAQAIAQGAAAINQCPPGGQRVIHALAALLKQPVVPLNPAHGNEQPLTVAAIQEDLCIGCTLCIQACPVDAIIGAPKFMHLVMAESCTGCGLCVPPCPMDCITMQPVQPERYWSEHDARRARKQVEWRQQRLQREQLEHAAALTKKAHTKLASLDAALEETPADDALQRKRSIVQAAIERAQQRQQSAPHHHHK